MEPPLRPPWGSRTALLGAVGLNLVGVGILALELFAPSNSCSLLGLPLLNCTAPSSVYGWFWVTVTICAGLPLLGLVGQRPALIGIISQGVLLFLSGWSILSWGFGPLFFCVLGGLLGLWALGRLYSRGVPGLPVTWGLLGTSWAFATALWMVVLLYSPNVPQYFSTGPPPIGPVVVVTFAQTVAATQLVVLSLVLGTYVAVVPFGRPSYWAVGVTGAIWVVATGLLLPFFLDSFTLFAALAGVALLIAAAGCREFYKTGRTIGQALDGAPPTNRAARTASPESGRALLESR